MSFEPRLTAPTPDNENYRYPANPFDAAFGLWSHDEPCGNCTTYCYGRTNEVVGVENNRLPRGNAFDWWERNMNNENGYDYGSEPLVGSVAVFYGLQVNGATEKPYGHVMFVEKVDGDIITLSGSDGPVWNSDGTPHYGTKFYVDEVSIDRLHDISYHGGIAGFIYLDIDRDEESQNGDNDMDARAGELLAYTDGIDYLGRLFSPEQAKTEGESIDVNNLSVEEYDKTYFTEQEYLDADWTFFLWKAYYATLHRAPDAEGLKTYSDRSVFRLKRQVVRELLKSEEFKQIHGYNINFDDVEL